METVEIELSENSYKIDIGYQFLSKETFSGLLENKEVLLVYDKKISGPALSHTESILKPLSNEFLTIGLEASEENKSQESIDIIHNLLLEKGFIDGIVNRNELKLTLSNLVNFFNIDKREAK